MDWNAEKVVTVVKLCDSVQTKDTIWQKLLKKTAFAKRPADYKGK